MDKKNAVSVRIFGSEYTIAGTESKEYIKKVCSAVNDRMLAISSGPSLTPLRTAVLCAVNMCDDYYKSEEKLKSFGGDTQQLKNRIAELEKQARVLKEENEYLKNEILNLKNKPSGKVKNA